MEDLEAAINLRRACLALVGHRFNRDNCSLLAPAPGKENARAGWRIYCRDNKNTHLNCTFGCVLHSCYQNLSQGNTCRRTPKARDDNQRADDIHSRQDTFSPGLAEVTKKQTKFNSAGEESPHCHDLVHHFGSQLDDQADRPDTIPVCLCQASTPTLACIAP